MSAFAPLSAASRTSRGPYSSSLDAAGALQDQPHQPATSPRSSFVGKVNLSIKDDGNAGTLVIDPAVASTAQNAAFDPLRFASSRHRTLGFAENDAGSSAPRTVADGGHAASIALLGKHMAASFVAAPFTIAARWPPTRKLGRRHC